MLQTMAGLPPGVLGFEINGELHADDYRDTLLPAIEAVLERGEKVRIVLVFEDFDGLSGGALWQDLRLGVEHLTGWERIALVTDIDWMIQLTALFGWMTPGDRDLPGASPAVQGGVSPAVGACAAGGCTA
jgi:SpoIIAA-like